MSAPAEPDLSGDQPEGIDSTPPPGPPPDNSPRGGRRIAAAVGVAIIAALLVAVIVLVVARDDAAPKRLTITIPAGTGERIADTEDVDVVDPIVRLDTNQELVVRNNDVRIHTLGPLSIAPGTTSRQVFSTEGRHPGATSLRNDGRITILVENN